MTQSNFKFTWVSNSQNVTKKDLPENVLDKQKGYIDQNSIVNLVEDFKKSPDINKLKKILLSADYETKRKGKPQRYDQLPKLMRIKIRMLFTALAVQRKIDWDHVINIVTNWDSRRPATVNVIFDTKTNTFYITDGQHTVMAIAIRALLGLFPDVKPTDYLDVEVNCQVVETSDFSFAREHFLGINGEDKLSILPFDIHKIHVFGKRLDNSPQDKYVIAERKQAELEKFGITVVHPESFDRFKSGAFIDAHLIKKLDVGDITFFGENHKKYWAQEPVDPMEVLPFQELRTRLDKEGADFNSVEFKEFMRDLNATIKEVAGGFAEFKNLTQQVYPVYYEKVYDEKPTVCPKDASLVFLLQLYQQAGGTYNCVPKSLTTRYREQGKSMFQCLSKEKKELFK